MVYNICWLRHTDFKFTGLVEQASLLKILSFVYSILIRFYRPLMAKLKVWFCSISGSGNEGGGGSTIIIIILVIIILIILYCCLLFLFFYCCKRKERDHQDKGMYVRSNSNFFMIHTCMNCMYMYVCI